METISFNRYNCSDVKGLTLQSSRENSVTLPLQSLPQRNLADILSVAQLLHPTAVLMDRRTDSGSFNTQAIRVLLTSQCYHIISTIK